MEIDCYSIRSVVFRLRVQDYSRDHHANVNNLVQPKKNDIIELVLNIAELKKFFLPQFIKAKNMQELINEFDNLRDEYGDLFWNVKFGGNQKPKSICILKPDPVLNKTDVNSIL